MHSEIELVKTKIEDCFFRQRNYLSAKPDAFLEDLRHESQSLALSDENLVRTAAAINQAACEIILEVRQRAAQTSVK